jgi:hypothetical protein
MPIEGFLALAFFPSPDFFFLTISWDWVLHYSIQNIYSWAGEEAESNQSTTKGVTRSTLTIFQLLCINALTTFLAKESKSSSLFKKKVTVTPLLLF